uniref:Putative secreted protein n=1 Tax=Ixodes scapularis TaxID=6945 RepID=A0A4D5RBC9_IXOSC
MNHLLPALNKLLSVLLVALSRGGRGIHHSAHLLKLLLAAKHYPYLEARGESLEAMCGAVRVGDNCKTFFCEEQERLGGAREAVISVFRIFATKSSGYPALFSLSVCRSTLCAERWGHDLVPEDFRSDFTRPRLTALEWALVRGRTGFCVRCLNSQHMPSERIFRRRYKY